MDFKPIIDRLFVSWKTTVLGLGILAVCFLLVFLDKASLTEVSTFTLGGFYLLFLKDENGKAARKSVSTKEKNKARSAQEESEQEFD
jgi:hypothetical protein